MDEIDRQAVPPEWRESLDRAEADVAAGRVVAGAEIIRRLRHTLRELESPHTSGDGLPREASRHR